MAVKDICVLDVECADLNESIRAAAIRMNARNVGTFAVIDKFRVPVGIITDRDIAMKVVAQDRDPNATSVEDVMTILPQTVTLETTAEEALAIMRDGPFRRLLVVDEAGKLFGIVTLDDILQFLARNLSEVSRLLQRESPQAAGTFQTQSN